MKILKWVGIIFSAVLLSGLLAFLYFMPPFFVAPVEEFSGAFMKAAPSFEAIDDPAERLLAERGRYIASLSACGDCHVPPALLKPQWHRFMAGGVKVTSRNDGSVVARNLTPDPNTGLGRRSDDEIKRVLRSGVFHTGRAIYHRAMPWPIYANWNEEDLHAVVVFLRHLKPEVHGSPEPDSHEKPSDPAAVEAYFVGADYGGSPTQ